MQTLKETAQAEDSRGLQEGGDEMPKRCLYSQNGGLQRVSRQPSFCLPPSHKPLTLKMISIHISATPLLQNFALLSQGCGCKLLHPKSPPSSPTPQNTARTKSQFWQSSFGSRAILQGLRRARGLRWGTQVEPGAWTSASQLWTHSGGGQNYSCGLTVCLELGETITGTLVRRLFSQAYIFSNTGGKKKEPTQNQQIMSWR